MVKIKNEAHILADGTIDLDGWLDHLSTAHFDVTEMRLIRDACQLAQLAGYDQPTEMDTYEVTTPKFLEFRWY